MAATAWYGTRPTAVPAQSLDADNPTAAGSAATFTLTAEAGLSWFLSGFLGGYSADPESVVNITINWAVAGANRQIVIPVKSAGPLPHDLGTPIFFPTNTTVTIVCPSAGESGVGYLVPIAWKAPTS